MPYLIALAVVHLLITVARVAYPPVPEAPT